MNNKKQVPSYQLDAEEKEILQAFEKGNLKSNLEDRKELKTIEEAARNTITKNRRINIRLPDADIKRIKKKAAESGIPYQTLIGSILHQYASGKLTVTI
ncbi:MAG: hypothetical protein KAW12_30785 [Candidatus Aminicenantes bacterium]|nr:hypothetical protein [Candidatus Aminicenantes bacterium]